MKITASRPRSAHPDDAMMPDPSLHPAMGGSGSLIIGRKRIAHALGRSERTISRWLRRGILPASKSGPHRNNMLTMRAADLDRLRARLAPAGE